MYKAKRPYPDLSCILVQFYYSPLTLISCPSHQSYHIIHVLFSTEQVKVEAPAVYNMYISIGEDETEFVKPLGLIVVCG